MASVEDKVSFMNSLYSPEIRQRAFHQDSFPHRDRLLLGPRASGKTRIGLAEAIWQSVSFSNVRGIYFTPEIIGTVRMLQELAGQHIITEPNVNPVNGLVTMRPFGESEPNYIRFVSNMDESFWRLVRMETFDYFVVDELPWHHDWHKLLKTRIKHNHQHPHRQGLYIYSGNGIPAWLRGMGCNQHFYKTFWDENYIADFLDPSFAEELRNMPAYEEHTMPPSASDGRRLGSVSLPSPEHRATGMTAEMLADALQGIRITRSLINNRRLLNEGGVPGEWATEPTKPPPKDEGVDEFIAEIDSLLDEPNEPIPDEEALPKAAPTAQW